VARRHPNHRLVKIHRNYSVAEIATLLGIHRNTVREWIKQGLPTYTAKRPLLILASDLVAFLRARRARNKRTCRPGEIYCVRCRVPRNPAGNIADYEPLTAALGDLVGICPTCESVIYRKVNVARLAEVRGKLDVTLPKALQRLGESSCLPVGSDFGEPSGGRLNHGRAQREKREDQAPVSRVPEGSQTPE
jgi:excisionase family DNA binding protein